MQSAFDVFHEIQWFCKNISQANLYKEIEWGFRAIKKI